MKVLTGLLVICAVAWNADALLCRHCSGASALDDCTFYVKCGADEFCYMDQIVTSQLSVVYNGGCRARDVCLKSPGQIGKRSGGLTMCSKCCSTNDCGTSLCNIPSSSVGTSNNNNIKTNQCYQCSDVTDMTQCTSLTTCQSDEVCMTETYTLGGQDSYTARCGNRRLCTLLTQEALKRRKECYNNPDPFICGHHGKRQAGQKICTACCGDGGCNDDTCENILDQLFNLWKAGVLDFNTLKTISTATTAYATTTYPSFSST